MAGDTPPTPSEQGTPPAHATNYFTLGADLLGEVQRIVGSDRVRSLRIKLGNRVVKEIPVGPVTAVATVALVLLAVVVSTMSIEVEHEPSDAGATSEASR